MWLCGVDNESTPLYFEPGIEIGDNVEYLYYSFLFAFLYVYAGLGLTLILCPQGLRKHTLFLAPMVGYCYLTLAGWLCYSLNLKGTDAYGPALLILPLVVLYYALTKGGRKTDERNKLINAESIAPIAVGIIAFIIISIPSITSVDTMTSTSLLNADIAANANSSRYLKEYARSEAVGFLGRQTNELEYVPHVYFGPCVSTALPSSLFSVETYKLEDIGLHIFFLFGVLLFYSLAREAFRYNRFSAILVMALYGLSPIMYHTTYQGFQGQIIGTALAMCLILLHASAIETCKRISDYYPYFPLTVLLTWGIIITYRHMLPLICVPLAGYAIMAGFNAKSRASVSNWVLFLLLTVAATSLLSPSRVMSLPSYFIAQGRFAVGWHFPLIGLDAVLGLTFDNVYLQDHINVAHATISILLAVLIVAGYVGAYKKDRRLFLLAASSVLPILLGYIILALPNRMGSGWGGYRSYKLLSFFLPQVLLGVLIVFRNVQFARKGPIYYLLPLSLASLLACSMVSCYAIVKQMSKARVIVSKDTADLIRVESDPRVESVNILRSDYWNMMWQAHFLMRKRLYFETSAYYGYTATRLDGQWDLKSIRESRYDIIHVDGFDKPETIVVNPGYVLERVSAVSTLRAQFEQGWYDSEGTHIWTGESGDGSSIVLESPKEKLAIDLHARYWPLDRNNRISIYLNGSKITDCPDNDSCRADGMILSAGQNVLVFKTALPPTVPSSADPRRLGYSFTSIDLSPSASAVHSAPREPTSAPSDRSADSPIR